jgi:hypothetical protein
LTASKPGFLAVEAACRAAELQRLHAGDLHDRAFGREITAGRPRRRSAAEFIRRAHDVWSGFHFTFFIFSAIVRPVTVKQSPCK